MLRSGFIFLHKKLYALERKFEAENGGLSSGMHIPNMHIYEVPPPPPPRARNYFSHCSSGPPVHFTHQTLTISSFGYLLWRNKRHCYPFYYSKTKSQQEDLNSHPENKQCNAVLHVALPTAPRAVDGSKGGLTNLYLGLNHPRWIGCMQMSTRGLWLAVCKWVRTGVRNCSGINNLAPPPRASES